MSRKKTVEELLQDLGALRLQDLDRREQERRIIAQLEEAVETRAATSQPPATEPTTQTRTLTPATAPTVPTVQTVPTANIITAAEDNVLRVGRRVLITNWKNKDKYARTGTITKFEKKGYEVHILTDDGRKTWRARHNVQVFEPPTF